MNDTMTLFGETEMDGMAAEKFTVGSWWEMKHVHHDPAGKVDQRYTSVGQVVSHGMWDNQFRIDWQEDSARRGSALSGPVEDYVEEKTIDLYTGRHYTLPDRIWLSCIVGSRRLGTNEVEMFQLKAQAFYDEWCWTQDEFDRWTKGIPEDTTGLWLPTFGNEDRECDHSGRWTRSVKGTFCRSCKAQISTTHLPSINDRSCMWWMYKGSMGTGVPVEHPSDCDWCKRDREKLAQLEKEEADGS